MKKKAIILDLDNTIYSVRSVGEALFHSLFQLIRRDRNHIEDIKEIKEDLMRRPFLLVAKDYHFSKELIEDATNILQRHRYVGPIAPYPDYYFTKHLTVEKFLVTTGFLKLQQSKIDALNIAGDFKEIHIIDPSASSKTKKDVFEDIMNRYHFHPSEIIVVGDDPGSEIKAASDLNIEAVLYDHDDFHKTSSGYKKIQSMEELKNYMY